MHQWVITDLSLFAKVMILDEYIAAWEAGEDPWTGGGDRLNKVE